MSFLEAVIDDLHVAEFLRDALPHLPPYLLYFSMAAPPPIADFISLISDELRITDEMEQLEQQPHS